MSMMKMLRTIKLPVKQARGQEGFRVSQKETVNRTVLRETKDHHNKLKYRIKKMKISLKFNSPGYLQKKKKGKRVWPKKLRNIRKFPIFLPTS